ncbi:MAG: DUF4143 domain-containing protein [Jatrophihabitantaceae bacterium]
MSQYLPRVVDDELDALLPELPAISIEGPKGVGKTGTARRRAARTFELDDPAQRELLQADHSALTDSDGTVLLDEWQRLPESWDLVRRAVDAGAAPGRFLLTGSATPTQAPTHSGAGRIVRLRMRPMSLSERGVSNPTVSLAELLTGQGPQIGGTCELTAPDYAEQIIRSGFPGIRTLSTRAARAQLNGYLERIVERDFPEQGHLVRRPATLLAWLRAYAAATATTTAYNTILDAATPGGADKPAKTTTIGYRDVLTQLWLLDPLPGWIPTGNQFTRLAQAPKHHLADPALAARLLDLDVDALRRGTSSPVRIGSSSGSGSSMFGALFESLITLDLRVYAQAAQARVSHLRTRNGDHEIDLILEAGAGRIAAFEVKLAANVDDTDVRHLRWLRNHIGEQLIEAAVITTGPYAYRRKDGIAVIPAALLGP